MVSKGLLPSQIKDVASIDVCSTFPPVLAPQVRTDSSVFNEFNKTCHSRWQPMKPWMFFQKKRNNKIFKVVTSKWKKNMNSPESFWYGKCSKQTFCLFLMKLAKLFDAWWNSRTLPTWYPSHLLMEQCSWKIWICDPARCRCSCGCWSWGCSCCSREEFIQDLYASSLCLC